MNTRRELVVQELANLAWPKASDGIRWYYFDVSDDDDGLKDVYMENYSNGYCQKAKREPGKVPQTCRLLPQLMLLLMEEISQVKR